MAKRGTTERRKFDRVWHNQILRLERQMKRQVVLQATFNRALLDGLSAALGGDPALKGKRRKPQTVDEWLKAFPGRADAVIAEVAKPWRARADRHVAIRKSQEERYNRLLDALAAKALVSRTPEPVVYAEHFPPSSQTNGGAYSRAMAALDLAHLEAQGLEAEVKHERYIPDSTALVHRVYVKCDALSKEIARRRPGLTLAESVRLLWKNGANPRVIYPGLPYDFESKHGFDMFGNKLTKAATVGG